MNWLRYIWWWIKSFLGGKRIDGKKSKDTLPYKREYCHVNRVPYSSQAEDWQKREGYSQNHPEKQDGKIRYDEVRDIHNWVRFHVKYVPDEQQFDERDWWAVSDLVLARMKGDCEDQAIARWRIMREQGFPDDAIGIGVCWGHAFAVLHYCEDDFYVLDNGFLTNEIVKASELFPVEREIESLGVKRIIKIVPWGGLNLYDAWLYKGAWT